VPVDPQSENVEEHHLRIPCTKKDAGTNQPVGTAAEFDHLIWDIVPDDSARKSNYKGQILEVGQCGAATYHETFARYALGSTSNSLTSSVFDPGNDAMDYENPSRRMWDSFGSPELEFTAWDSAVSTSPNSTHVQQFGQDNNIEQLGYNDQQHTTADGTHTTGSVSISDPAVALHQTIFSGEQSRANNIHGVDSAVTPLPISDGYESPTSTTVLLSGDTVVHSTRKERPLALLACPAPIANETQCACWQDIATLWNEISTRIFKGSSTATFDTELSFLKSALSECNTGFKCTQCMCHSGFCMLLATVTERLVTLSEDVTVQHVLRSVSDSDRGTSSDGKIQEDTSTLALRRFGSYDLSAMEHGIIACSLMTLHVQSCRVLVKKLIHVARLSNREAHVHLLVLTDQQVDHLLGLLGNRTSTYSA
jgi:hypothetical protein